MCVLPQRDASKRLSSVTAQRTLAAVSFYVTRRTHAPHDQLVGFTRAMQLQPFLPARGRIAAIFAIPCVLLALAWERRPAPARDKASSEVAATPSHPQLDSALRFPIVPDPTRTPGATLDVTAADICVPGYSHKVRNVPVAVKREVYASYGVKRRAPGEYEVDHLVSLGLGGSNSVRNLWPQSFRTLPWNAGVKDALENELHRRVCAGTLDLATAQRVIASNWVIGYRKYVHSMPLTLHRPRGTRRARRAYEPAPSPVP